MYLNLVNLAGYALPLSLSAAFVAAYIGIFRLLKIKPRMIELLVGAVPVSIAAVIAETYLFNYTGTLIGLIIAAPILEEALKFVGTVRKRDTGSGLGVGLGFALVENLLYFNLFLSGHSVTSFISVSFLSSQIVLFVIMRGTFDPLLHSTLAGLSTRTWQKGKRFWLPIAMGFHAAYNFIAVIGQTDLLFLFILDLAVVGPSAFLLLKSGKSMVLEPPGAAPPESKPAPTRKLPKKEKKFSDIAAFVFWLRENGKEYSLEEIMDLSDSDDGVVYEPNWFHQNTLINHGLKYSKREIGPYGALLIAGLAALGGIVVWVLFL